VGNLHINFTTAVYSPTNITSLFYPVSEFSYFCTCDTPLNCYHFTRQSYPFAHLTSFRRLQNSLSKTRLFRNSYFSYRRYVVQLCTADRLILSHPIPHYKRHLGLFSRFCRAHRRYIRRDRQIALYSVCSICHAAV